MTDPIKTIFIIVFIVIIILLFLFKKNSFNRHKKNQKTSKRVIEKLKTFDKTKNVEGIINYLRKVNPYVYEEIVLDGFDSKKWKIIRNKRYSGDGGIDGKVINQEGIMFYIQAKRYKGYINPKHVNSFKEKVENSKEAQGGFFIHTGTTSAELRKQMFKTKIYLIGGKQMVDHITE
jgi:restriction system protein